jgi:FMN-dependent oxidoreductase (nitrilotriacetate monooxygenase family)
MPTAKKQIHLSAFLNGVGHHLAAWRHPEVDAAGAVSFWHYRKLVALAEAAKFDAVFFADNLALPLELPEQLSRGAVANFFEPSSLLFSLAPLTTHIGLIATVSSTYMPPFHTARKFASLDHISGGRAGWNLVTSATDAEARNFGLKEQIAHKERYAKAAEYVAVVKGLWQSWDKDAFLFDKEAGRYFDPNKLHVLNHEGPHYAVRGPLSLPPSPQGHPVIVQAGSSEDGQALAAETAEMVFTAQPDLSAAKSFADGLRARLAAFGRSERQLRIMPGLQPFVGRSREEAQEKFDRLQALIDPEVGLGLIYTMTGIRLSPSQLDQPFEALTQNEGMQSRIALFSELGRGLTLRQLMQKVAGARGHGTIIGTPKDIVDYMEAWIDEDAADGFNIMAPILPGGLEDFIGLVLPELRNRGRFRSDYEGTTLRKHLGLEVPA